MNCVLYAAGNGLRLRPITNDIQKCLLPVGGKPMLEWWIDAVFNSECFDDVFVNIHHMADEVEAWIKSYSTRTRRLVRIINERDGLLGTAGTLRDKVNRNSEFMIAYTDTFCGGVFSSLPRIYMKWERISESKLAGIVTFKSPEDGSTGNVICSPLSKVERFEEKGGALSGKIAWSGVMFGTREFFSHILPTDKDLARDTLTRICNRGIGNIWNIWETDAYDIGRGVEQYEQFKRTFGKQSIR